MGVPPPTTSPCPVAFVTVWHSEVGCAVLQHGTKFESYIGKFVRSHVEGPGNMLHDVVAAISNRGVIQVERPLEQVG